MDNEATANDPNSGQSGDAHPASFSLLCALQLRLDQVLASTDESLALIGELEIQKLLEGDAQIACAFTFNQRTTPLTVYALFSASRQFSGGKQGTLDFLSLFSVLAEVRKEMAVLGRLFGEEPKVTGFSPLADIADRSLALSLRATTRKFENFDLLIDHAQVENVFTYIGVDRDFLGDTDLMVVNGCLELSCPYLPETEFPLREGDAIIIGQREDFDTTAALRLKGYFQTGRHQLDLKRYIGQSGKWNPSMAGPDANYIRIDDYSLPAKHLERHGPSQSVDMSFEEMTLPCEAELCLGAADQIICGTLMRMGQTVFFRLAEDQPFVKSEEAPEETDRQELEMSSPVSDVRRPRSLEQLLGISKPSRKDKSDMTMSNHLSNSASIENSDMGVS